jgi:hypothetical protein
MPPEISGNPDLPALPNEPYHFEPTAADPDGDTLTFSIVGKPSWLDFDPATGRLDGTPSTADLGSHDGITITVFDGEHSVSLAPFSIAVLATAAGTATLTWLPPVANTDGSPLLDLAGHRVYWGRASGHYQNSATVDNPAITTYVVENLLPGAYYFAIAAFDTDGAESAMSNEVSITIPATGGS